MTEQRISKPVLFAGIVVILLAGLGLWFGLRTQGKTTSEPAAHSESNLASVVATPLVDEPVSPEPTPTFTGELPPVVPISLKPFLAAPENGQWLTDDTFLSMPRGTQSFGGIEFWLEGMLQLQCKSSKVENRKYRETVAIVLAQTNVLETGETLVIQRGSNVGSLHLVGATRYAGDAECTVAEVLWRYTDGTTGKTPIKFDNHVRDWVRNPYEAPSLLPYQFSKVIWHGPLPRRQEGRKLRLYRFSYANPQPAKNVRQLEIASTMQLPGLFVVGLTLDPLLPGMRPDDSPNLEPTDLVSASELVLLVQSRDGQPVANAQILARIRQLSGKTPTGFERMAKTDDTGSARVPYPPQADLDRLEVSAAHDEHGSVQMVWSTSGGDLIPASYVLKLREGIAIGGIVVDDSGNPISDAKISLGRFWTGGDEMNRTGEQASFRSQTQKTDADGRWQARGLPVELLDRISLAISHPDFVETNFTVGDNQTIEAALREGTLKTVLKPGLIVRGKVTDESDTPIESAKVWAGRVNYSGTKETKTDATGSFNFRNLKEGETQFSVLAKGREPTNRNVTVKMDMEEIIFKLGRGAVIRGLVRDEAGEPVAGVRIALESSSGGVSDEYQFEMTSNAEGRFEWDGSPNESKNFCFLKTGFEAKRKQTLKPNEENIVTLRKGRKVQGLVLDADTEKPVTKFRAGVGRRYDNERFYADWPGLKDYVDLNGTFTIDVSEEEVSGVKAEADDYAAKVEKLPEAQGGIVQVTLRLKPSGAVRGVLVNQQGSPVAGATVAVTLGGSAGMPLQLRRGRLSSYDNDRKIVTTDAGGNFALPSPPESGGMVVAVAESGFATAPVDQVRASGRLVLLDFGRIEGTIKVGGSPTAGAEFTVTLNKAGVSLDWNDYRKVSDEQGRFVFDRVPAGEHSVVRLIKQGNNSWSHSHATPVTVVPGQTAQVTFGESGAVINGRVRLEIPPADGETIFFGGNLATARPDPKLNFSTSAEAKAYFESPEWQAHTRQQQRFGVTFNADGTLTIDSVPPGNYTLSVTASKPGKQPWESNPVANGSVTVTVPEGATSYNPIHVGEIVLRPMARQ